jgi:predicted type IV restriction endonuclease
MAALTTAQEYAAIREAIQLLTTLDSNGERRDRVSVAIEGMSISYAGNQLDYLQKREMELARRLSTRNSRKRVTPDFSY